MFCKKAKKTRKQSVKGQYRAVIQRMAVAKKEGTLYKVMFGSMELLYPEVAKKLAMKGYNVTIIEGSLDFTVVSFASKNKSGTVLYEKYTEKEHWHYLDQMFKEQSESIQREIEKIMKM